MPVVNPETPDEAMRGSAASTLQKPGDGGNLLV
jgi:hypothetical protein